MSISYSVALNDESNVPVNWICQLVKRGGTQQLGHGVGGGSDHAGRTIVRPMTSAAWRVRICNARRAVNTARRDRGGA